MVSSDRRSKVSINRACRTTTGRKPCFP